MKKVKERQARKTKSHQGEGSFKVQPNGRVHWRTHVTTPAGEQRHASGTARTLTEARKAVQAVRAAAQSDALPPRERLSVAELVGGYIAARADDLKQRTIHDYNYMLSHYIAPRLGSLKAQMVNVLRLREFFKELGEGARGLRTRQKVHALLRAAYRWGITESLVTADPTGRARPRGKKAAAQLKHYTPEQAVQFYTVARNDRLGWPMAFMLATGLRPGEALGLTWSDVTFTGVDSAVVRIERTLSVMGGKVYTDVPKTERGRRVLHLSGDPVRLLRECQAQTEKEKGARLRYNGHPYQSSEYVFVTHAGTPYRPDNLRRPMERLCLAADIPRLTPHKLRHTYTTVMAAQGISLEVLSAQLGHGDANVTRGIYRHVLASERHGLTYDPTAM